LARSLVCECYTISTMPHLQPPRRMQHADFLALLACLLGLEAYGISCRKPRWSYNPIALEFDIGRSSNWSIVRIGLIILASGGRGVLVRSNVPRTGLLSKRKRGCLTIPPSFPKVRTSKSFENSRRTRGGFDWADRYAAFSYDVGSWQARFETCRRNVRRSFIGVDRK
jgi:hypothetical protein